MLLRDILKDVKNSQYRKVITNDKLSSKTRDRNLVDINQERRGLEDKYEQALKDGDKGLAKSYSDRLEELRKEAIEAENKRDEERKNFGDAQASAVEPTNPSHIAAAKRESVAKGVAATTGKTTSDKKSKVKDKLSRLKKTLDKINDILTQDPLTGKGEEILSNMKEQYGEEKGENVFYASKNKGTISGVDKKTKDADDVFVHHVEGAYKVYADGRLVGTYQSESEAEDRADEFRNKTKDAKSDIYREWSDVRFELFGIESEMQKMERSDETYNNPDYRELERKRKQLAEKEQNLRGQWQSAKDAVTKTPPDKCDYCGGAIGDDFYDAKLDGGSWGDVCKRCFRMHGEGLGTGRGQHYRKTSSGVFEKTNDKKTKDQNISEEIIKILVEKGVDRKQADAILMKNWDKIISQISQGFLVPDIAQALFFKGTKDAWIDLYTVTVQKQKELGSENWGVYVNGRLEEGGFFDKEKAEEVADRMRKKFRANIINTSVKDADPDMLRMYQQKLEDAIDSGDKEEMKRWGRELISEVMGTRDDWSPEARKAAIEARRRNAKGNQNQPVPQGREARTPREKYLAGVAQAEYNRKHATPEMKAKHEQESERITEKMKASGGREARTPREKYLAGAESGKGLIERHYNMLKKQHPQQPDSVVRRWASEGANLELANRNKKTKDIYESGQVGQPKSMAQAEDADEEVCKECKKNYDPDKADSRDPDSFCSSKCETAHKANEAQYRHDTTKDNYAEELKKMRDQLEKAKEEGDEDKARDLEIEIADFIKETADKKTKDSKTRDNLYAELRDAKRDISRIDNLVSNDTVTKMYGGGGIIQQEIDNEMKKREELKQKVKELEQKIADLKKQGIDPYYV